MTVARQRRLRAKALLCLCLFSKKDKKTFQKVLTRGGCCDIIVKLSAKRAARSLKIEQQEISAKHCKCEKLNLVKELYILIQK